MPQSHAPDLDRSREDPRDALEVSPTAVDRRGIPAARVGLLVLVVLAFVGLAVLEPWKETVSPQRPAPVRSSGPTERPEPRSAPPFAALLELSSPRASWGIRAIAAGSDPGEAHGLVERFFPSPSVDVETGEGPAAVFDLGRDVFAIGVTTRDTLALDVRFWLERPDGAPRRVLPIPLSGPDPGSWMWVPDPSEAGPGSTWRAGRYRVDVLVGGGIVRFRVNVDGPPAAEPSPTPTASPVGSRALETSLRLVPPRSLFAVADGAVVQLPTSPTAPLGEFEAWLEPGPAPPGSAVGRLVSTDVTALGVMLPATDPPPSSPGLGVRQVAPLQSTVSTPFEVLAVPGPAGPARALLTTGPSSSLPFAAGTYRLTASWITADGAVEVHSWHVDVVPRVPPNPPGSPLAALARWARGTPIPGGTDGEVLLTDRDLRRSGTAGVCDPAGSVATSTTLLGLLLPAGEAIAGIRLSAADGANRVDTRAMLPGPDGLALLALPPGGLAPGRYRLDVIAGALPDTAGRSYGLCVR